MDPWAKRARAPELMRGKAHVALERPSVILYERWYKSPAPGRFLVLLDDEAEYAVPGLSGIQKLVAGGPAEGLEVADRCGVRRQDFEGLARLKPPDPLLRLHDGIGAVQTLGIDCDSRHDLVPFVRTGTPAAVAVSFQKNII